LPPQKTRKRKSCLTVPRSDEKEGDRRPSKQAKGGKKGKTTFEGVTRWWRNLWSSQRGKKGERTDRTSLSKPYLRGGGKGSLKQFRRKGERFGGGEPVSLRLSPGENGQGPFGKVGGGGGGSIHEKGEGKRLNVAALLLPFRSERKKAQKHDINDTCPWEEGGGKNGRAELRESRLPHTPHQFSFAARAEKKKRDRIYRIPKKKKTMSYSGKHAGQAQRGEREKKSATTCRREASYREMVAFKEGERGAAARKEMKP